MKTIIRDIYIPYPIKHHFWSPFFQAYMIRTIYRHRVVNLRGNAAEQEDWDREQVIAEIMETISYPPPKISHELVRKVFRYS